MNDKGKNQGWKDYFNFTDVINYYFRKKDPERKTNFNLKVMHGINRIAIIMFLIALIVLIFRHLI